MKSQLHEWKEALKNITLKKCAITLLGSFILAFGLYHVHSISGVTEGGVLGATLLLEHWTGISPALTGGIMNVLCYVLGWKLLGKEFIAYSALATVGFSGMYKICEQFPHLWPGTGGHAPCGSPGGCTVCWCGCRTVRARRRSPQWRRCPGHEYFPCRWLEDPVGLSAVGSDRAGHVLELYPGTAHRVFAVHRAFVRTADRVCTEL